MTGRTSVTCGLPFTRTDHRPVTLAMRVEGDGRPSGTLPTPGRDGRSAALGPGLDLALCEATYHLGPRRDPQHMSGDKPDRAPGPPGPVAWWSPTAGPPSTAGGRCVAEATDAFGGHVEQAAVGRGYSL